MAAGKMMSAKSNHSWFSEIIIRALGSVISLTLARNRVCVINYHRVLAAPEPLLSSEPDIDTFRWQMKLLARCFHVMTLKDALLAISEGKVPSRAVCITFDDGYRSIHELALPVLNNLGLPATVFVSSGFIGQGSMWNDRIIEAVQSMPIGELDLTDVGLGKYSLKEPVQREKVLEDLIEKSKYLPPLARDDLVNRISLLSKKGLDDGPMLTSEMIVDLASHGIEIGAHTVSHPILKSLDDIDSLREISQSKADLEKILGKPVRYFAYPNGKVGVDFDERHVAMVRDAGFEAAFTTAIGTFGYKHDRYQLPRSRPWDATPLRFGLRLLQWFAQAQVR